MHRFAVRLPLALVLVAAACESSSGPAEREVTRLLPLGGDGQTAAPGTQLPNPLTVAAFDFESRPVAGVEVSFTVRSGGGTMSPQTVRTDENGLARSHWTLGFASGAQQATASLQTGRSDALVAEFTATAAAPDGDLRPLSGEQSRRPAVTYEWVP